MKNTLRDDLWLWGHDAGCHHTVKFAYWKIPGINRMQPAEAAKYLDVPNCCRVGFGGFPEPPLDKESQKLRDFRKVVWSALGDVGSTRNDNGADDLDEVMRQAEMFPNITGVILDDLFRAETKDARVTVDRMCEMAQKLHSAPRPLELWIVYYTKLLGMNFDKWLDFADVVTYWSWTSEELSHVEENIQTVIEMTPSKKHYAGCYLYNYGDCRPVSREEMDFQLDLYLKLWKSHRIDGIIALGNTVVDVGLEAPEIFRKWVAEHGNETR